MIVCTPDERLTLLQAMGSRRKDAIATALPAPFDGTLVAGGYAGYQHLLERLSGIQQCCQPVIRRRCAAAKLGPGNLQAWAEQVIAILGAHRAVEDARARGATTLDPMLLAGVEERYDQAVSFGAVHNRLRDRDSGNHPGYALAVWLRDHKEQVFLFTRGFPCSGRTTSPNAEQAKAAKRHQAVSGCWHTLTTLARGAASAATSTPPPPTAPPRSMPSPAPSPETLATATTGNQLKTSLRTREWTPSGVLGTSAPVIRTSLPLPRTRTREGAVRFSTCRISLGVIVWSSGEAKRLTNERRCVVPAHLESGGHEEEQKVITAIRRASEASTHKPSPPEECCTSLVN